MQEKNCVKTLHSPLSILTKWEMECFNVRFPLPTLLYAGYGLDSNFNIAYMYFTKVYYIILDQSVVVQ